MSAIDPCQRALPFGDPPKRRDAKRAKARRDRGIERAIVHAEDVKPGWGERSYTELAAFLAQHEPSRTFMGEDVRFFADERGLDQPPHLRSWGAVLTRAARAGLIVKVGCGNVSDASSHRGAASVWRMVT